MTRTFSFMFDSAKEAWANCPAGVVAVNVIPHPNGKFELRYSL